MKTKLSLILGACLLSTSLYAKPSQADEIAKLQKQLEQISKELMELKAAQAKTNEDVKTELSDLQDRADETEFQAALGKVKFGLDFSTAVSNTNYNVPNDSYSANNKWVNELHLNMFADINENTKFYGRLSMAKGWNAFSIQNRDGNPYEVEAGRSPRSSGAALYVDRAYLDYMINPSLIATIGRQPGTDGPGSNLRNNALRQSTYPALLINVLGDAAILTYKPEQLSDYKVAIRGGFGKTYQYDEEGNVRDWMGNQDEADANLFYGAIEGELPLGDFGQNLLVFNMAYIDSFSMPLPAIPNALINPALSGNLLNEGVYNLGDLTLANLHFENYNTLGYPLHYFVSLGYSHGKSSRDFFGNPALAQIQDRINFNEEDGYSVHTGFRYDFTKALKFGYEFFYGSRYWYTLSKPSINDPLNIRVTRGIANDIYVIYQIDRYQFLRLSYTNIQNHFSNSGLPFGGARKVGGKSRADNIMLMYNVKF